jgi:hypothetical protein
MFAVDSSLNESVIAIWKFNNLDSNMRAIGKGLSGRKMLSIFEENLLIRDIFMVSILKYKP